MKKKLYIKNKNPQLNWNQDYEFIILKNGKNE